MVNRRRRSEPGAETHQKTSNGATKTVSRESGADALPQGRTDASTNKVWSRGLNRTAALEEWLDEEMRRRCDWEE